MATLDDVSERFDSMEKRSAHEPRQLLAKTARIDSCKPVEGQD